MRNSLLTFDLLAPCGEIGIIDKKIIGLVARRFKKAKEIERVKRKKGLPISRPQVEKKRLAKVRKLAKEKGINPFFAAKLFRLIINESRRIQKEQRKRELAEPSN